MTTYAIPSPSGDSGDILRWDRLARVQRMCAAYLPGHEPVATDDGTTLTVTFTPDLTPSETQMLTAIVRISGIGVATPTEYASVLPDAATLRTYVGLATPTNAQSVAAIKSLIRVLGVLVRD